MAEVDHEVEIAAEESDTSGSELGESVASSTTSLSASILEYRIENGRTYHRYKDGKYGMPNDETEAERLDLQHDICVYTFDDRLGMAPPCDDTAKVGRVLDIGAGTGSWAMDFGDLHPESEVLGVDLSPVRADFVPPNVRFEIDDVEDVWTYSQPFEYIHSRFMTAAIDDWDVFIKRCYDNLTPGGYLELQEADVMPKSDDDLLPKDSSIVKYVNMLHEASEITGRKFVEAPPLKNKMIEAGFVDVELRIFKWPHNTWPKDERYKKLGLWTQENFGSALEALCMAAFTRVLGWTRDEVNVFLIDVRNDLKNKSYHAYCPVYCITGRKPEKEKTPPVPQEETEAEEAEEGAQ
ncbi:TAM domain methyltransferase [Colletotrichum scovillei]|uniref:TAM domain methyltransferase n=1 Tax=Colletotrichum scovillei TaxID=1209932 RepID=UPI0015C30217|nr:TAM domain methyltransferase [Colletotrichum scovillei]KAF4782103.1 TAM domain methyltransferase [Colletotrichum scovillei]